VHLFLEKTLFKTIDSLAVKLLSSLPLTEQKHLGGIYSTVIKTLL